MRRADARFARNPFVTGELDAIRCYVAHPLVTRDGVPVGTLCVFDSEARELDPEQLAGLATLAERGPWTSSRCGCAAASWR